jgi:uncharacterized membrane protein
MRRSAIALLAGTIIAIAGANSASAAVATTVSIRYNAAKELFHGTVSASEADCVSGRLVKLYEATADGPSLQGKDRTNDEGVWKIDVMHPSGHYFAVAPRYEAMHTTCAKDRSKTIDVM